MHGCALFHDLLKPAAILCKVLQQDDVCVVEAIEAILNTSKAIEKLASTSFENLPTVKMVSSRMVHNADGSTTYQEANLTKHKIGTLDFFLANVYMALTEHVHQVCEKFTSLQRRYDQLKISIYRIHFYHIENIYQPFLINTYGFLLAALTYTYI